MLLGLGGWTSAAADCCAALMAAASALVGRGGFATALKLSASLAGRLGSRSCVLGGSFPNCRENACMSSMASLHERAGGNQVA